MNKGAISGLPYNSAVEVSCVITKDGPVPLTMGELPVPVRGLIQTIKSFEQMAIEAAVEGSREKAIVALTINPLVANDKLAIAIVDEMLEAHKEYLPRFYKKQPI